MRSRFHLPLVLPLLFAAALLGRRADAADACAQTATSQAALTACAAEAWRRGDAKLNRVYSDY